MKLGVNYLKEVEELFEEGKIDFVDYFKLFSLNEDISGMDWCIKHRPLMFHGVIGKPSMFAAKDLIKYTDATKMKDILSRGETPYISGHISTCNQTQTLDETFKIIKDNVENYKKTFGKEVVLENIPYGRLCENCLYMIEPEVISKIIYDNECLFLFDISHARKAAEYLHMPFEEYVSKLPMDRVIEIHLAGMYTRKDGERMAYHAKMNEEDYAFLEEALKKYSTLQYITLEYGSYFPKDRLHLLEGENLPLASFERVNPKVKEEVYEQLIRLKEIINRFSDE